MKRVRAVDFLKGNVYNKAVKECEKRRERLNAETETTKSEDG